MEEVVEKRKSQEGKAEQRNIRSSDLRNATMRREILLVLVLAIVGCNAQQSCPSNLGWNMFRESCYKFEAFPSIVQSGAMVICQQDGAHLLSVNSFAEHEFITKWLLQNDIRRVDWITSGKSRETSVFWDGDSTISTTLYYKKGGAPANGTSFPVVYTYTGTEYLWGVGSATKQYAFICEIKLNDVYKIIQEFRDFDYGMDVENAGDAPRGPTFLQQPHDTAILGENVTRVTLECLADGNPEPSYEWVMRSGSQWVPVPLGGRYTITTGKLEISKPQESDENSYQCRASNDVGTSLSTSAQLSFGSLGTFNRVPSAKVTGAEYSGIQIECPTIEAKPAKTYQWYKDSVLTFIRPNFQKHTFLSRTGKLYFSELNLSDQGMYYCVVNLFAYGFGDNIVSVSSDSKTSEPFELKVTSGGGRSFQPEILNQFPYVFPPSPVKGGDVLIECFAYGTGPLIYTWSRTDNKPLPLGHSFDSNNRILYLTKVQLADSGPYKCHVKSTTTNQEDEATTQLVIQARPYFTYPLTHMHLDVGSRLSWHCEAAGMPSPTYTWYKNGKVFTGDVAAGIVVSKNSLTIEKVEVERDSGMYQCGAENLYGVTFSTAQLRVLKIPPSFDKRPMPKSITAALNGEVTITCNPVAAPIPNYKWLKDGSDLNLSPMDVQAEGVHYQLLRNGNLIIRKLAQNDQGRYTCEVDNGIGTASDYTDLLVLDATTISTAPANDKVEVNLTATLLCRGSHSPEIDNQMHTSKLLVIIDYFLEPEYRPGEGNMKGSLY
ncbi:hypothetical protein EGW08_020770, partial [Elysia chlorotica]